MKRLTLLAAVLVTSAAAPARAAADGNPGQALFALIVGVNQSVDADDERE